MRSRAFLTGLLWAWMASAAAAASIPGVAPAPGKSRGPSGFV